MSTARWLSRYYRIINAALFIQKLLICKLTFKNVKYESNLVNKSQIDNNFFRIKNVDFIGTTPK